VHTPHNNSAAFLGKLEEHFHARPLDRRLATGGHDREDITFLHASGNQRVQLELGVLT
jgi:hypothetical protein